MRLPARLLQRKKNVHKGDFGHIFIVAGSRRYSGAAVLCSMAAMRSGAGLVTLGVPRVLSGVFIKIKPREAMLLALPSLKSAEISVSAFNEICRFSSTADVLVIGPGLGNAKSTHRLACKVIAQLRRPTVIDADALNALAKNKEVLRLRKNTLVPVIMTPHAGEMARLAGVSAGMIAKDRAGFALKFAKRYKVVLVLKGHNTIVADPLGKVYRNKTGNPGMATAGSGDCLTGMIAAFLGQGLGAYQAACCAVYVHGLAGDLAAREKTEICLIASDIIDKIPEAIKCSGKRLV